MCAMAMPLFSHPKWWSLISISGVTQRQTPLVDISPIAGRILRLLYLQDPDIATLYTLLRTAGGALTMDRLLLLVLREAPNIGLSLFCSREGRTRLLELLQRGHEELAVTPLELPRWFMARSRFQLKRQLVHVGLLAWEAARSGSVDEYTADRDVWRLRSEDERRVIIH
jgi:hypothetical protein